ncbi:MAG: magnesium transporter [Candidatus Bathyarchaeales archaeon]
MTHLWKMVKESLASEILSISGGTLAGLGLAKITGILEAFPGMIIMVPAFMGLRGNILGALSARLGTALHTGLIDPKELFGQETVTNLVTSLFLSVFVNSLIGFLSYIFCFALGIQAILWKLVVLGALSGALASVLVSPLTIILAIIVFRRGIDPDNVMGPIVTSLGDVTALICLSLVAMLILWIGG